MAGEAGEALGEEALEGGDAGEAALLLEDGEAFEGHGAGEGVAGVGVAVEEGLAAVF